MDLIPQKSEMVWVPQKTKILVVALHSQVLNYLPEFHEGGALMRELFCVRPHKNVKIA